MRKSVCVMCKYLEHAPQTYEKQNTTTTRLLEIICRSKKNKRRDEETNREAYKKRAEETEMGNQKKNETHVLMYVYRVAG